MSSAIKEFQYYKKLNEKNIITDEILKIEIEHENNKKEIKKIEADLSNETIGADKFNEALHKFLGRREISIHFNSTLKGYEITRNNSIGHAKDLSEGEKTAIAFVYFIIKLQENRNKINETIIVVDDPISSFDSNHLFHAYSFLKNHCGDAKQLFILTHNFTFFKLVRDWIIKKNKFNSTTKTQSIKSNFYTIETTTTIPRFSTLTNSDKSLTEYNSEYHYLFSKLYRFKEHQSLTIDEAFTTANIARKLMESLLSFKFPKKRNDFSQLIECGIKDEIMREKIYRFINKYSHNMSIEINEDSSDNIMGESKSVISDIFSCIKTIDETHYQEMVDIVGVTK